MPKNQSIKNEYSKKLFFQYTVEPWYNEPTWESLNRVRQKKFVIEICF